jgi:hypothetical protein
MPSNENPTTSHHVPGQDAGKCSSYAPGHQVHWIQMRKSLHEDIGLPIHIHIDQELAVVQFMFHDEPRLFWHHDTARIVTRLHGLEGEVEWRPRFHVLAIPHDQGSALFNLARLDQVRPCRS